MRRVRGLLGVHTHCCLRLAFSSDPGMLVGITVSLSLGCSHSHESISACSWRLESVRLKNRQACGNAHVRCCINSEVHAQHA
jgi:hypothetical protein